MFTSDLSQILNSSQIILARVKTKKKFFLLILVFINVNDFKRRQKRIFFFTRVRFLFDSSQIFQLELNRVEKNKKTIFHY